MILKGAFGVHLFENRSDLNCLKNIDGKNTHHPTKLANFNYMALFTDKTAVLYN